ncbi:hypothetical protein OMR07_06575 [Methylobacterium organophilum]|nr:hypothetical protein [Methylobacterium organophilum]
MTPGTELPSIRISSNEAGDGKLTMTVFCGNEAMAIRPLNSPAPRKVSPVV